MLVLNVFPGEIYKLQLPVYCSVGLHPWHAEQNTWKVQFDQVVRAADKNNVIAIGETGLDKTTEISLSMQQEIFEQHIRLSESLKKPLIIHCVRSYSEMLSMRKKTGNRIPWIFHWYNADEQTARALISKNCYLSFGNMLFKEESKAFRTFSQVNPDYIFLETDDTGYTIQQVYDRAANLKNISVADLQKQIMNNFSRCFQIP